MIQFQPFKKGESLLTVFLNNKEGKFFIVKQIASKVFDMDIDVFIKTVHENGEALGLKYWIKTCRDPDVLMQCINAGVIEEQEDAIHLMSLASLDTFMKNYSQYSNFTRLYDLVHKLRWQNDKTTVSMIAKNNKRKRKLTSSQKKEIAAGQYWRCNICRELLGSAYEVDHIVQFADGGSDDPDNLQALCANCHAKKTSSDRAIKLKERFDQTYAFDVPYPEPDIEEPKPAFKRKSLDPHPEEPHFQKKRKISDIEDTTQTYKISRLSHDSTIETEEFLDIPPKCEVDNPKTENGLLSLDDIDKMMEKFSVSISDDDLGCNEKQFVVISDFSEQKNRPDPDENLPSVDKSQHTLSPLRAKVKEDSENSEDQNQKFLQSLNVIPSDASDADIGFLSIEKGHNSSISYLDFSTDSIEEVISKANTNNNISEEIIILDDSSEDSADSVLGVSKYFGNNQERANYISSFKKLKQNWD
eukprot:TRINITY_DN4624_c0_g1_i3.p1 TRINITY_DN4624_c0_g1~~TRINITY_DN4624_c0_g1_i3.p1  ORF type:complete len:472 (-),score=105.97 TRINITY_DN4624_c0_g1_i3:20-1435(-)